MSFKLKQTFVVCLSICVQSTALANAIDLQEVIYSTLRHHPSLLSKELEIESKEYLIESSKSRWFPSVSLSYGSDQESRSDGSFYVEQPLYTFGKNTADTQFYQQEYQAELLSRQKVKREIVEEASILFSRIQGLDDHIAIIQNSIDYLKELIATVKRRKAGGMASDFDVAMGLSRVSQTESELYQLQSERDAAIAELQVMTHLNVTEIVHINPDQFIFPIDRRMTEQVIEEGADLRYRREMVEVAEKDLRRSRLSVMPTLSLRYSRDFSESSAYEGENRISLYFQGSLQGLGFSSYNQSESQRAIYESAIKKVDLEVFKIKQTLNRLYADRDLQQRLIVANDAMIDDLNTILESNYRQYSQGRKTWLEVLSVLKELTAQKVAKSQAENKLLRTKLVLLSYYSHSNNLF